MTFTGITFDTDSDMKITYAVLLCFTLFGLAAHAEIYKTVDEHGNTVYTDNPGHNDKAEPVDLPELNTQPPVPVKLRPEPKEEPSSLQYEVYINSPQPGTQVPMGQYEIPVSLSVTPELQDGDYIQILLNGQPFGQNFYTTSMVLRDVYRGEHQLQAVILNGSGIELARSDSVTIYVQRPSVQRKSPR